jgi:hypothetical protein
MNRNFVLALAAIGLAAAASGASGASVMLGAMKDATIFQNNVNNSSGAANGLTAGTNGNAQPRRALVAFDVAGSIPAGAIIQDVKLHLVLGSVAGGGGPGGGPATVTVGLHEVLANWGEGVAQQSNPPTDTFGGQGQGAAAASGDVTWNSNFHSTSLWTAPGGDFDPVASASAAIGTALNGTNSWLSTAALVSNVQSWLDNPGSNFGWVLKNTDEATANTGRTFYSSDAATASFHPQLEVTYDVVPEPATAMIAAFGAATTVVASHRRGSRRK